VSVCVFRQRSNNVCQFLYIDKFRDNSATRGETSCYSPFIPPVKQHGAVDKGRY